MKLVVNIVIFSYVLIISLLDCLLLKSHCEATNFTTRTIPQDESLKRYFQKVSISSINRSSLIIDLRQRAFQYLPADIFRNTEVKILNLAENQLADLPEELANLTKVEYMNLMKNRIKNITSINVLNHLSNLKALVLSRNPLKSLDGLNVHSLLILEAGYCEIEKIDDDLLNSFPFLEILNLTGNTLVLTGKLRSDNLTELLLSNCQLTNLPNGVFEGLENLKYLDLSDNKLRTLPDEIFSRNDNLIHLNLSKNNLQITNDVWFNEKKNLLKLDLSKNELTSINDTSADIPELVDTKHDDDGVVAVSNLESSAINSNISRNLIGNQRLWDLSSMKNIRSLDLSRNKFFGDCDKFKSASLRILDLAYNNLSRIKRNTFADVPNLMDLNLSGNQFSRGADMVFDDNKILVDLKLEDNPFRCNCSDLYPIFLYLAHGKKTRTDTLLCWTPENAEGESWWDICAEFWKELSTMDEQVEISRTWLIATSAVFVVCLFVGSIGYIVYTFRPNLWRARV